MHALRQQTHTHLSTRKQWQCFTTRHIKHNRVPADQQKPWQKHRAQAPSTSTAVTSGGSEPPQDTSVQLEVPEGIAEPMSEEAVASEKQRQKKLWFAAVKPPMYTVSIIPILVSNTASEIGTKAEALAKPAHSKPVSECRFLLQLRTLHLGRYPSANACN